VTRPKPQSLKFIEVQGLGTGQDGKNTSYPQRGGLEGEIPRPCGGRGVILPVEIQKRGGLTEKKSVKRVKGKTFDQLPT